jgi:hypothetical protein
VGRFKVGGCADGFVDVFVRTFVVELIRASERVLIGVLTPECSTVVTFPASASMVDTGITGFILRGATTGAAVGLLANAGFACTSAEVYA